MAALHSIDLERVSVAVILIEGDPGLRYLEKRGYHALRLGTVHDDYLAWRPDLVRDLWSAGAATIQGLQVLRRAVGTGGSVTGRQSLNMGRPWDE